MLVGSLIDVISTSKIIVSLSRIIMCWDCVLVSVMPPLSTAQLLHRSPYGSRDMHSFTAFIEALFQYSGAFTEGRVLKFTVVLEFAPAICTVEEASLLVVIFAASSRDSEGTSPLLIENAWLIILWTV